MRVIAAVLLSTLLMLPEASAAPRRRSAGRGGGRTCDVLSPSSVSVTAFGAANGCDARVGDGCDRLQPIELAVSAAQYDFSCAPHTITWDFGDGATATSVAPAAVRHQYLEASSYVVTATIRRDGVPSVVVQQSIKVYEIPYACAPMTDLTLFMTAIGLRAGCNAADGQGCDIQQPLQFSVHAFGYDFGCSPHTVTWDFGDGLRSATSSRVVLHQYAMPGAYVVSAMVTNDRETFVVRRTIHVYALGF